jgi:putative ABC transport system permease protein
MQVRHGERDVRAMVVGVVPGGPGEPGQPGYLVAGRHITRGHYEAVADLATGFALGESIQIRRSHFVVVGLTRRMVSSSGDPMVFIPLKDAQEAQFLKDNDASPSAPPHSRQPGVQPSRRPRSAGRGSRLTERQSLRQCRAGQIKPGSLPEDVAEPIRRWKRLQVYTRSQMEGILIGKLIATSARQIALFLVILAIVSAAIVAFIIYTLTLGKMREIAVLKLIGTKNRTIAAMILQQAVALGLIGGQDRCDLLGTARKYPARAG